MSQHFGEHLTIDGYDGDFDLLSDKNLISQILTDLPRLLDMHTIIEPQVVEVSGNDFKDPGGVSGFVMIAESHISIHTFPKRGFLSADIYTCRNGLDQEKVEQYFKDKFVLQGIEVNFIIRGTRYPERNII